MKKSFSFVLFLLFAVVGMTNCTKSECNHPDEGPTTHADSTKIISFLFENFANRNDVEVKEDGRTIAIAKSLLTKMDVTVSRGNLLACWLDFNSDPFYRRVQMFEEKNDSIVVTTSEANVIELLQLTDVTFNIAPYVNFAVTNSDNAQGTIDKRFVDNNGALHPTYIKAPDGMINSTCGNNNCLDNASSVDEFGSKIIDMRKVIASPTNASKEELFSIDYDVALNKTFFLPKADFLYVGFDGKVKGQLGLEFSYDISWFKLKAAKAAFKGNYDADLKIKFGAGREGESSSSGYGTVSRIAELSVWFLYPFPIRVGVSSEIAVKLGVMANAKVGLEIPFHLTGDYEAGLQYANGKWNTIGHLTHKEWQDKFGIAFSREVTTSQEIGAYVKTSVHLGGVVGPFAAIGPRLSAAATIREERSIGNVTKIKVDVNSSVGVVADVGVYIGFLGYSIADISKVFTLAEYDWIKYNREEETTVVKFGK